MSKSREFNGLNHAGDSSIGPQAGDPLLCARCHSLGQGCCVLSDSGASQMFGLTGQEISVMAQASGLDENDFVVADVAEQDFLAGLKKIHPVFEKTMPGGRRLRLRVDDAGACCFLGSKGCTLPSSARPLYCRLYPFWFTKDDRLMVLLSETCLAQENAISWREVLARLGEDQDHLRGLFDQLLDMAAGHEAGGEAL